MCAVPGLDDLLTGSSVIDAEFKFDLAEYLARVPNAPVTSLGEIIDGGLIHAAVEPSARRRNAVPGKETDEYRRALIKRETIRQGVIAAFDEHRLDAMVYPVMRRKPALIGEAQGGSNCQLSAASGLPALAIPAGLTTDGLPIGLELLGRQFDEGKLLALGFAFEQASHARQPPFSAPPLVNGRAPASMTFSPRIGVSGEGRDAAVTTTFRLRSGDGRPEVPGRRRAHSRGPDAGRVDPARRRRGKGGDGLPDPDAR